MTKPSDSRRLRIPVRFIDGVWECSFGGAVPVTHGTEAELYVRRSAISDVEFLQSMELKGRFRVLDEGTPLLVCLTIKAESLPSESLRKYLMPYSVVQGRIATDYLKYWSPAWSPATAAFVEVKLASPDTKQARLFEAERGGLWLMTEGIEAVGLASTQIVLPPEISDEPAKSLNHALTKLSEIYETWRISHTGSIYSRVLYQERSGTWYPLEVLRDKALDKQGKEIANSLWETFQNKMKMNSKKK